MLFKIRIDSLSRESTLFTGEYRYTLKGDNYGSNKTTIQLNEGQYRGLCEAQGRPLSLGDWIELTAPGEDKTPELEEAEE